MNTRHDFSSRFYSIARVSRLLLGVAAAALGFVQTAMAAPFVLPMLDSPMAYVLRKGELETTLMKEKINDTLDLFDVKASQVQDIRPSAGLDIGAIGDLDGWRGVFGLGLANRTLLRYVGKRQDIEFGRGTAHRVGEEISVRHVILRETPNRPAISIEPIYRANRGSGISRTFTEIEAFGVRIIPPTPITLRLGGVHDESYGARALASKQVTDKLLLSLWAELSQVEVGSEVQTNLPVAQIRTLLDSLEYSSRHVVVGIGGHYVVSPRFVAYGELQHYDIDREITPAITGEVDTNDVVRGRLMYRMGPVSWLTLEGDYFANQLGGEVPFLFNRLSASRFEKIYGFVGLGVTYQFSLGKER